MQGWSPGEAEDAPETGVVGKARRPCLISCGSLNDPEVTGRGLRQDSLTLSGVSGFSFLQVSATDVRSRIILSC